jgi:hypothetical protein
MTIGEAILWLQATPPSVWLPGSSSLWTYPTVLTDVSHPPVAD